MNLKLSFVLPLIFCVSSALAADCNLSLGYSGGIGGYNDGHYSKSVETNIEQALTAKGYHVVSTDPARLGMSVDLGVYAPADIIFDGRVGTVVYWKKFGAHGSGTFFHSDWVCPNDATYSCPNFWKPQMLHASPVGSLITGRSRVLAKFFASRDFPTCEEAQAILTDCLAKLPPGCQPDKE